MEGHITIYGEIIPWQDENVEQWGAVNLKGVMNEMKAQTDADELVVHIHSNGGSVLEAFAIHDALIASGKPITTVIEGLCASSATIIALAGEKRKMMENSEFMIHLPFAAMFGDSEDMQKAADQLKEAEDRVANFYATKTGGDAETMHELMKEETWMSSEDAQKHKFVNEVITTVKAVARINIKNDTMSQMTAKELETKMDGWFAKLMKAFKPEVKMITVTTADGTILDFGDAVEQESQIVVGTTATVDGSPAEGEHVLTDGRTLVFAEGAVTEIKEAEGEEETMETLKAKLEEAEAKIAEMESEKATAAEELATMQEAQKTFEKDFKEFKATMMSDMGKKKPEKKESNESGGEETSRKLFKEKE